MPTLTLKKLVDAEITAVVVDATNTYAYFGTNEGEVYRVTIADGTLLLLKALEGAVMAITLYSTTLLYVAVKGGYIYSLTTT